MASNPLQVMWIIYTFAVSSIGVFVLYGPNLIPVFLTKIFKFGKSNKDGVQAPYFVQICEVPKRWFAHFYIFASIFFLSINFAVWARYFRSYFPTSMVYLLDIFSSIDRKATVVPEAVVISCILVAAQACRRCYECHFVSIYSDAKMNVLHYVMGLTYYFGVGLSLISEAPGFLHKDDQNLIIFTNTFSWSLIIGVILFIFGFVLQWKTNIDLANLRKDKEGNKIITLGHVMPTGGWFDLISCPHYFAEIVMYSSVGIITQGQSMTWLLLCIFTVSNQIIAGLLNHAWYKSYFKSYPSSRKAVIPYVI